MSEYFVRCSAVLSSGFNSVSYDWAGVVNAENGQEAIDNARTAFNEEMVRENMIDHPDEIYISVDNMTKL